mmetsp:Transcript_49717/g.116111  ORF Transcript_49717/g.116111 Transcript_49717/m.116111 type:complete len:313 (+) Transcript_49717:1800-2738(+)
MGSMACVMEFRVSSKAGPWSCSLIVSRSAAIASPVLPSNTSRTSAKAGPTSAQTTHLCSRVAPFFMGSTLLGSFMISSSNRMVSPTRVTALDKSSVCAMIESKLFMKLEPGVRIPEISSSLLYAGSRPMKLSEGEPATASFTKMAAEQAVPLMPFWMLLAPDRDVETMITAPSPKAMKRSHRIPLKIFPVAHFLWQHRQQHLQQHGQQTNQQQRIHNTNRIMARITAPAFWAMKAGSAISARASAICCGELPSCRAVPACSTSCTMKLSSPAPPCRSSRAASSSSSGRSSSTEQYLSTVALASCRTLVSGSV